MKFEITQSPNSYLTLELSKNEKIIIEKGCLIYSDGEYDFENKIEMEIKDLINSEKDSNIYKIDDFNQKAISLRKKEIEEVLKKKFKGIRF